MHGPCGKRRIAESAKRSRMAKRSTIHPPGEALRRGRKGEGPPHELPQEPCPSAREPQTKRPDVTSGQFRAAERSVAGDDCDGFAGLTLLGFAERDEVAEALAHELDF